MGHLTSPVTVDRLETWSLSYEGRRQTGVDKVSTKRSGTATETGHPVEDGVVTTCPLSSPVASDASDLSYPPLVRVPTFSSLPFFFVGSLLLQRVRTRDENLVFDGPFFTVDSWKSTTLPRVECFSVQVFL